MCWTGQAAMTGSSDESVITAADANNPQNQVIWWGTDPLTSVLGVTQLPLSASYLNVVVD